MRSWPTNRVCTVLAMSLGNCSIWLSGAHYRLLCFILFYSYFLCIVIFSSSFFIVVLSNVVSFLFICSTITSYLMVLGMNPVSILQYVELMMVRFWLELMMVHFWLAAHLLSGSGIHPLLRFSSLLGGFDFCLGAIS